MDNKLDYNWSCQSVFAIFNVFNWFYQHDKIEKNYYDFCSVKVINDVVHINTLVEIFNFCFSRKQPWVLIPIHHCQYWQKGLFAVDSLCLMSSHILCKVANILPFPLILPRVTKFLLKDVLFSIHLCFTQTLTLL